MSSPFATGSPRSAWMGPAAGGHTYITVVVNHERHRVIRTHNGYGRDVFNLFFQQLTEEQRASIRVVTGDGAGSYQVLHQ